MTLCVLMSPRTQQLWRKIKYAFRVTPEEPLREEEVELMRRLAGQICRRGMSAPAILALESARPLGFLGSQALIALKPFLELLVSRRDYERFISILERRDGVARFITCIEQAESEEPYAG